MFFLLSSFITIPSIILFLILFIFKNNSLTLSIGLILSFFSIFLLNRKNFKTAIKDLYTHLFSLKQLPQTAILILIILLIVKLISPMIIPIRVDNFDLIGFNGLGDYYKHLYVLVPIIQNGIPPQHPYFPPETMSYYFGFYIIPATLSVIFLIPPTITLFFYVILSLTIALILISALFNKYLKSTISKVTSLVLLLLGAGVDIIPLSTIFTGDFKNIIYNQAFLNGVGLQLSNFYTTLLLSPQHLVAAVLVVILIHHLLKETHNLFFLVTTTVYIFLSSTFISLTLMLWFLISFIFFRNLRQTILKTAIFSTLLLLPFLLILLNRQNILFIEIFKPIAIISNLPAVLNTPINYSLTFIFQYGPIITLLPIIFLFQKKYKIRENRILFLGLFLPFFLTWFIKSPDFNDFSLRALIPCQIILTLIFVYTLEKSKGIFKPVLISITFLSLITGAYSLYLEYSSAWKDRKIIDPKTSQLLYQIRKLPNDTRLAAIEKEDWVYYIPPLGFKNILNPHLRESAVSTTSRVGPEHSEYENMAFNIFLNPTIGKDLEDVINKRNLYFLTIDQYFKKYSFDLLLMDNQIWVKKGQNPYNKIFLEMGIDSLSITPNFTAFKYDSLVEKNDLFTIKVNNNNQEIPIAQKHFPLKAGFWFLAACSENSHRLTLELEDYYSLFNQNLDNQCIGNFFYIEQDRSLLLTNNSNINNLFAFPVEIIKN